MPGSEPAARPDPAAIATRPEFARALTALREAAGLTVRDVARAAGMPDSTVGGYFSGRHLPPIKPPELLRQLLGACGVTAEPALGEWTAALQRVRRAPGRRPAGAPVPYRGLASFGTADAVWFHGREALVEVLVDRVRQATGEGALVPVVGPSGSGKSSLLAAGLVPALANGPARVLATSPAAGPPPVATRGDVLLVDQAEEVFTAYDERGGRRYLDRLVAAARGGAVVVLGLRADFYPQSLCHPELAAALQHRQVVVGPMTTEELRRAIVRPALTARLDVEDGLVELLLRDLRPPGVGGAAHDPGALPLLSHTLLTMWSSGQRRRLTLADYQRAGGVDGAVARTAEEVYAGLDPAGRLLARGLFGRLVHLRDGAAVTRRRVPRAELPPGPGPATVLNRFVERRLLTVDADSVEVSHEALLWAWPRLREWIETDRAGLHTHRRLTEAAAAWLDSGQDEAALYHGTRLAAAREWAEAPGRPPDLNPAEAGFLAASVEHERRERGAARRRTHRLYQLLAAVTVLLVVTGLLAGYAFRQRGVVARERDLALSRQVATLADQLRDRDPSLAMQLSLVAYRVAPTVEATSSLLGSTATGSAGRLLSPAAVLQAVAFAPDGRTMAAAGSQGTVLLWSVPDRGAPRPLRTLTGHTGTVYALAFSPDGRRLATGGDDRTVRIWDLSTPGPTTTPTATLPSGGPSAGPVTPSGGPSAGPVTPSGGPSAGPVTPSGGPSAGPVTPSGGPSAGPVTPSGGPLAGGPVGTVYSLAFAPDGRTLAAGGSDGKVRLWRVGARLTPYGPALPADGPVQAVAFAPGGGLLAAGTYAGTVRLWRTGRPAPAGAPLRTGTGTGHIFAVAFAPDGRTLAASGTDRTVHLWGVDRAGRTTARAA